ncbi:hypothetical protein PS467_08860 [Streptomyces luomodiensis]|uniref:Uncharacterized protein n=1 Tax=Streptomyces luomodiensis TaxID=3026192 RepID=A0ABY9USB7_9ACTN|nr:hypothetical protein PS467_08860 [Streptomyces sp. SCA4-21]
MLLRLAYLGVTNTFALLRLLPMSDRDKDAEILALRHQITVLERQLGSDRVRFTPSDRAFLAALLHWMPLPALRRLRLLVRPDTVLRGIATSSGAVMPPYRGPSDPVGLVPCGPSGFWCCVWRGRIRSGGTDGCTVSCSCWG